jgi:hypothetical protein
LYYPWISEELEDSLTSKNLRHAVYQPSGRQLRLL